MYFYTQPRSVKLRIDVSNTLSQRFPLVKELKNILIGPFEFVYYLHVIHSVKLTKIVGVESGRCNLVPLPQPKIASYAPVSSLEFNLLFDGTFQRLNFYTELSLLTTVCI